MCDSFEHLHCPSRIMHEQGGLELIKLHFNNNNMPAYQLSTNTTITTNKEE